MVAAVTLLAASCATSSPPSTAASTSTSTTTTTAPSPTQSSQAPPPVSASLVIGTPDQNAVPSSCTVTGQGRIWLPDPRCTPGALNPEVNQANIGSTICVPGFSSSIRPPQSFTYSLKRAQMAAWGIVGSTRSIEEDHLVPLSLGGAPSDARNLWPEQGGIPNVKDTLEYTLYRMVCRGDVDLSTAQHAIAQNWVTAYQRYVGPLPS